jgi:hypothetical protein
MDVGSHRLIPLFFFDSPDSRLRSLRVVCKKSLALDYHQEKTCEDITPHQILITPKHGAITPFWCEHLFISTHLFDHTI